jgi:hypothetical protein
MVGILGKRENNESMGIFGGRSREEIEALLAYDAELAAQSARANAPSMSEFLARMGRAVATTPTAQSVKSAVTLPGDVYAGRQQMGLPSETEDLSRVADLAGLAMTGGIAGAPRGAVGSGPIRAYHGSPHNFDKFSLEHIGKGEGAQAYGHGLYFAENEGVARDYRKRLAGDTYQHLDTWFTKENTPEATNARLVLKEFGNDPNAASAALDAESDQVSKAAAALIRGAKDRWAPKTPGKMYEVAIHADPDKFLDWDKSLGQQRGLLDEIVGRHGGEASARQAFKDFDALSTEVLAAPKGSPQYERAMQDWDAAQRDPRTKLGDILGRLDQPKSAYGYDPAAKTTGETLYRGLDRGDRAAASQVFLDAGIPGIKYLDAGSRAHGDGSRNYVVFDDQIVEILKKYGVASIAALPPAIQMAIELGKPSATSGEKP